jgi:lysophospholipase L1-like esterase
MRNLRAISVIFLLILLFQEQFSGAQDKKAMDSVNLMKSELKKAKEKKAQEELMKIDWPNLGRFRDSNAKLGSPAKNEKRVVFMGNSITEGWIVICPEFFSGRPYINRGISGQTTPQMLIRFRADVINLKPKVVVILAGTNDIAGNTGPSSLEMIEDNIESMVDLARTNGIKVVLSSVLPAFDYWWSPGVKPAEKIAALNVWIKNYALNNNIVYIDYYSQMVDNRMGLKSEYSEDGVHPNKAGYLLMAPLVEKAIAKAMGQK